MKIFTPRVSEPVFVSDSESSNILLRKAFAWMFVGLSMTAIIIYFIGSQPDIILDFKELYFEHGMAFILILGITNFIISLALSFIVRSSRFSPTISVFLFLLFAAIEGLFMLPLVLFIEPFQVGLAFFISASMFGLFALIGYLTKINLATNRFRLFLGMAFGGMLLVTIFGLFIFRMSGLILLVSYGLIILSCIAISSDLQFLRILSKKAGNNSRDLERLAILGAFMFYLNFIIIFRSVLRILYLRD